MQYGDTILKTPTFDLPFVPEMLEYYAGTARAITVLYLPAGLDRTSITIREPLGVVGLMRLKLPRKRWRLQMRRVRSNTSIWTKDLRTAMNMSRQIQTGTVWLNQDPFYRHRCSPGRFQGIRFRERELLYSVRKNTPG